MKKYFILFSLLLLILTGCSLTVDQPKAKLLVENLLNDLKNENFAALDKYYISTFNESEPAEKKIEKYKRLKEVAGSIMSYEFISATEKYDNDTNIKFLELVYHVKGSRLTLKETFQVMNHEGDLKIFFQNIENMK